MTKVETFYGQISIYEMADIKAQGWKITSVEYFDGYKKVTFKK